MSIEAECRPDHAPHHQPVMLQEVLDRLQCRPGGLYVDATCGLGGHAGAILHTSAPDGQLLALDRDETALALARERLAAFKGRVRFVHDNFKNLPLILNNLGLSNLDGVLFDLGVSSLQLEAEERGFGFRSHGPLDMRMDRRQKLTAADLVNDLDETALADLIYTFGEEPASRRIARSIVRSRERSPIRTTSELASIVARSVRRHGMTQQRRHEATRTFQALRIAVNDELRDLDVLLYSLAAYLRSGGRLVAVSFHSLEDRLVKTAFRRLAGRCVCGLPSAQCGCNRQELVRLVTPRPDVPTQSEVERNPRSRSAKLRCVEKL